MLVAGIVFVKMVQIVDGMWQGCLDADCIVIFLLFIFAVNRRLDEWVKLDQLDLNSVEAVVDEKVEEKRNQDNKTKGNSFFLYSSSTTINDKGKRRTEEDEIYTIGKGIKEVVASASEVVTKIGEENLADEEKLLVANRVLQFL
ncbi:hypothetical protein D0Y65_036496 [Glycine soja]|uniref:Uncharacterized protein n=1 Tax=Glycine soja TaxID=3848 RepID=A0A445HF03_GLYSO|nr:hypothetical protein D0Y65_036496 [Glycine soja]